MSGALLLACSVFRRMTCVRRPARQPLAAPARPARQQGQPAGPVLTSAARGEAVVLRSLEGWLRRSCLFSALALSSTLLGCGAAEGPIDLDRSPPEAPPLLGSIRWDAWVKGNDAMGWVARSLYTQYKHREAFYGWFTAGLEDEDEERQIMEREIDYAAEAGIDYWAFVWYPEQGTHPQAQIQEPFNHYLRSPNHDRVKFTVILQAGWLMWPDTSWSRYENEFLPYIVGLFADPQYVKVDGGRPVVMLFHTQKLPEERLEQLRQATIDAGHEPPYFVNVNMHLESTLKLGLHAVTSYGPSGANPRTMTHCWAAQAAADKRNWGPRESLDTVVGLTPMADPRPRRDYGFWIDQPTRQNWRQHLTDAFEWVRKNPKSVSDPPLMLIYNWNELDEGGPGIVPTKQEGTRYLDDIKAVRTGDTTGYLDVLNGNHCELEQDEGWQTEFPREGIAGNRDSDEQIASAEGSVLHLTTTATGFEWLGTTGPDRGRAAVRVDDGEWSTVDLYSPELTRRASIHSVSELEPGEHDYQIRVTGSKHEDSTDAIVGVDEVLVQR
jgi:hypothetical protein